MLQDYVETVMEGLQTVANILAVKKVGTDIIFKSTYDIKIV